MPVRRSALVLALSLLMAAAMTTAAAAQRLIGAPTIALKRGETSELGDLYWVINCRSQLRGTPTVEIVDGPPGVSVTVRDAMVMPRLQGCAKPVAGGKVTIAANEVEDYSYSQLTLRITYRTRDGDRQTSAVYNLSLFP